MIFGTLSLEKVIEWDNTGFFSMGNIYYLAKKVKA